MNILSKEEFAKIHNNIIIENIKIKPINEAAVDWDKSALGMLLNTVVSPFAWLGKSIKKGYRKQQLKKLYLQWGIEYVKALRALDLNIENKDESETETYGETEPTKSTEPPITQEEEKEISQDSKDEVEKISLEEAPKYLDTLKKEVETMNKLKKLLQEVSKEALDLKEAANQGATLAKITGMLNQVRKLLGSESFNDEAIKKIMDKEFHSRFDAFYSKVKTLVDNINSTKNSEEFFGKYNAKPERKFIDNLFATIVSDLNSLIKIYNSLIKDLNDKISPTEENKPEENKPGEEKKIIPNREENTQNIKNDKENTQDNKTETAQNQEVKTENIQYSTILKMINEVNNDNNAKNDKAKVVKKEFKIPQKVEDLMPIDQLQMFEKQENIKKNATAKVNIHRLNTIQYEADYILQKAAKSLADASDKSVAGKIAISTKNDKITDPDLQREWDQGKNNVNDYFQNVIDTVWVENEVKKLGINAVPDKVKEEVQSTNEKLDKLRKMNLTETPAKLDKDKLYAFMSDITGTKKQAEKIILVSPTYDYIDKYSGDIFYHFKCFGAYTYLNNKITRDGTFMDLSHQASKSIYNYVNKYSYFYFAITALKDNANRKMFVYDQSGNIFFNDAKGNLDEVKNYIGDGIGRDLDETIKNLKINNKKTNIFNLNILHKFEVNNEDVAKYILPQNKEINSKMLSTDPNFKDVEEIHHKYISYLNGEK